MQKWKSYPQQAGKAQLGEWTVCPPRSVSAAVKRVVNKCCEL